MPVEWKSVGWTPGKDWANATSDEIIESIKSYKDYMGSVTFTSFSYPCAFAWADHESPDGSDHACGVLHKPDTIHEHVCECGQPYRVVLPLETM